MSASERNGCEAWVTTKWDDKKLTTQERKVLRRTTRTIFDYYTTAVCNEEQRRLEESLNVLMCLCEKRKYEGLDVFEGRGRGEENEAKRKKCWVRNQIGKTLRDRRRRMRRKTYGVEGQLNCRRNDIGGRRRSWWWTTEDRVSP